MDKGGINVYEMRVSQQQISDGFAVGAYSPQGSRFKLLLFQQDPKGEWDQLAQASDHCQCFEQKCPTLHQQCNRL